MLGVDVSTGGPALLIRAAAWTLPAKMARTPPPVSPLTAAGVICLVGRPVAELAEGVVAPAQDRLAGQQRQAEQAAGPRLRNVPATPGQLSIGTSLFEMPPGKPFRLGPVR